MRALVLHGRLAAKSCPRFTALTPGPLNPPAQVTRALGTLLDSPLQEVQAGFSLNPSPFKTLTTSRRSRRVPRSQVTRVTGCSVIRESG